MSDTAMTDEQVHAMLKAALAEVNAPPIPAEWQEAIVRGAIAAFNTDPAAPSPEGTPETPTQMREADRMVDEARDRAAAKVREALGPSPAERERE
jgi:hypothetical protein